MQSYELGHWIMGNERSCSWTRYRVGREFTTIHLDQHVKNARTDVDSFDTLLVDWLGDGGPLVRMVRRDLGSVDLIRYRWSLGDGECWIRTLTLRARA